MKQEENPFLDSRIKCKNCKAPITANLIIQYIQSSLVLSFIFTFCATFTILTLSNDLYHHYFNASGTMQQSVTPYKGAMFFAGLISFFSWIKVKRNKIEETREALREKNG